VESGTWGVAPPPRLNVDLVMNTALCVKTLQVRRQQGGSRELHRLWCWPQRSSHGRDQLGYQPCTLTPRPAPKSTTTLFYIAVSFLLFFLRKSRGEVLKKNQRLTFLSVERWTPRPFAKRAWWTTVAAATPQSVGNVTAACCPIYFAPPALHLPSVRAGLPF
jgi:hypothetical protein